jgi:hypothetical protein
MSIIKRGGRIRNYTANEPLRSKLQGILRISPPLTGGDKGEGVNMDAIHPNPEGLGILAYFYKGIRDGVLNETYSG